MREVEQSYSVENALLLNKVNNIKVGGGGNFLKF